MKSSKFIIAIVILFSLLLISTSLKAQENEIISLVKGEKVQVLDNSQNFNARIYFFITYPSCSSCIKNFESLRHIIDTNLKIEYVFFISGPKSSKVNEIAKQNNWNGEVIADIQNLYSKQYKVSLGNCFLIFDNDGRFIKAGDFSSESFNPKGINTFLKSELFFIKSNSNPLKVTKSIAIMDDTTSVVISGPVQGLYSYKYYKYLICDVLTNNYYIIDELGKVTRKMNVSTLFPHNKTTFLGMAWKIKNEIALIHTVITDDYRNWYNKLYEYDLEKDAIKESKIKYFEEAGNSFPDIYGIPNSQDYLTFSDINKPLSNSDRQPLCFLDQTGSLIQSSGRMSAVYNQFSINDLYREFASFSNTNIYTLQNLSNTLFKYSYDGDLIDTIPLQFGMSKRNIINNPPIIMDKKSSCDFLGENTLYSNILIDKNNENILVSFTNSIIPKDAIDMYSPLIKKANYINIFNSKGELLSDDIELKLSFPDIMSFENNKLVVCHTSNDVLSVQWYDFIPKTK